MWRRSIISLLVTCAAFFYIAGFPDEAVAQYDSAARAIAMERSVGLRGFTETLTPRSVPVRLLDVQGPDTLEVGESGAFYAVTNVGKASLPVRSEWDFGDGITAKGLHTVHRFSTPGTHSVGLRLWNDHGEVQETVSVIVVPTSG